MATTKKIKANLNKPTRIKMRANGKWDMINYHTFTDWYQHYNLPLLIDYDGLKSNNEQLVEAYKCNFSDTTLPWKFDYKNRLNTSKYCLMPMGQTYSSIRNWYYTYNCSIVGNLTIDHLHYIISGFSSTKYVMIDNFNVSTTPWEITVKIKTGTMDSVQRYLFGQLITNQTTPQLAIQNSKLAIWLSSTGSSWDIADGVTSDLTLEANTEYTIKCYFDGSFYKVDIDNINYILVESSTVLYSNNSPICFGYDNGNGAFNGSIDFSETYININNTLWWKFEEIDVPEKKAYFSDYTNVTSDTNGVITGYGNAPSFYVIKKANPFTFQTKVTAPNTSNSTYNYLIDIKTSSGTRLAALGRRSSTFCYYSLSNNSSSSNYTGSWANNTTKWLRIYYPGSSNQTVDGVTYTAYYLYFLQSDNGISWSTITSRNISSYFLGTSSSTNQFSYAYFGNNNLAFVTDMKETFINNGGYREYTGAVEKKQSLPGCTYNFNDNGQPTTLNVFTKDKDQGIILTPDNKYSDERLLGTVDIPEHPVYTYINNTWIETPVFEQDKSYEVVLVGGGGGGSTWPGGAGAYWHGIITPHEDIPVTITVGSGGSGNSGYSRNNNGIKGLTSSITGEGLSISCEGGQGAIALRNGDETGALSTYTYAPTVNITNADVFEIKKSVTERPHQKSWIGEGSLSDSGAGGNAAGSSKGQGKAGIIGECYFNDKFSTINITTDPIDADCSTFITTYNDDTYTLNTKQFKVPSSSHLECTTTKEGYLPQKGYIYYPNNINNLFIKLFTGTWEGDANYYINHLIQGGLESGVALVFYVNSYLAKSVTQGTTITILTDEAGKALKIRRGNPEDENDDGCYILENDTIIASAYGDWTYVFNGTTSAYDVAFYISGYNEYFAGSIYNYNINSEMYLSGSAALSGYTGELTVNDSIYEASSGFSIKYLGFSSQSEYSLYYFTDIVKPDLVSYIPLADKTITINPIPADAKVYVRRWIDPESYEYYEHGPGEYIESKTITVKELDKIQYKVEKEGYLPTEKTILVRNTETITVELVLGSLDYLTPIVDDSNFEIYEDRIRNGSISYNINNGYSFKYITYTPSQNETLKIVANINASENAEYRQNIGACYVGTALYQPTHSQLRDYITDGNGSYLYNIAGATEATVYSMELTAGTTYYIHFIYSKDDNLYWDREDRCYIYGSNIDFRS